MAENKYKQVNVDINTHQQLQELSASEGRTMVGQMRHMIQEMAELRDRNSTYLLRLKQEEQTCEGWRQRALKAEEAE